MLLDKEGVMLLDLHWGFVETDRNCSVLVYYHGGREGADLADVLLRLRQVVLDSCTAEVRPCCREVANSSYRYCPTCGTALDGVGRPSDGQIRKEVDRFWTDTADEFQDLWDRLEEEQFEVVWPEGTGDAIEVNSFPDLCTMTVDADDCSWPEGLSQDVAIRIQTLLCQRNGG